MAEQFVNDSYGYLDGNIDAVQVAITVQDNDGFPLIPDFHIRIGTEIMLVTARDGQELTVTRGHEGTTAGIHYHNELILQVITAEVLNELAGGGGVDLSLVPLLNGSRSDPAIVFTADGDYILVPAFA